MNFLSFTVEVKEIRDALRDPELQKMILKIDGSSEPEKVLEKVMEGQAFRQFTDKILDIVSPQEWSPILFGGTLMLEKIEASR